MLMEMDRSILNGVSLEQKFRVEFIDNFYYLVNRSPTLAINDITTMEV